VRLLLLTAGFGEGHNAAARNLASAHDDAFGPGAARVADLFALASPRLNQVSRRAYLGLINRLPGTWRRVYTWLDVHEVFPRHMWFLRRERRLLEALLREDPPDAIACTFPAYAFLLDALRAEGRLRAPFYNVVTDSISVHSLWTRPSCDGWFVPNVDTGKVMGSRGVPADRMEVAGFPVPLFFADQAGNLAPPDLSRGARPRVLMIVHSGTRGAEETALRLLGETTWDLTFAVGRDEGLKRRLDAAAQNRSSTSILGWTNRIPELLMTHHVVVSKAGGATTQEAIAALCPMVVNQIVPGQEEGNWELLRRAGAGAHAADPVAVLNALHRAFADSGRVWGDWRKALAPLARREASRDVIASLVRRAKERAA
jgi:processive 1,2-diacylglycerol beta-glucosyltransferase